MSSLCARALPGLACCLLMTVLATSLAAQTPPQALAIQPPTDEIARAILHKSLHESVWGPPAYCVVRQTVDMFGKQMNGVGDYVRGGGGTGKLKLELRFSAHDHLNTLHQVCDGQRLLTIENIGDHRRRAEVDLGRIRPKLNLTTESLSDPTTSMYLAIGGQAEVLRKLCQRYRWTDIREGQLQSAPAADEAQFTSVVARPEPSRLLGTAPLASTQTASPQLASYQPSSATPIWILTGELTTDPPMIRSQAIIDDELFRPDLSGLVPTQVQILVARQDARIPFWLYEVKQTRPASAVSDVGRVTEYSITTEWTNPVLLAPTQLTPQHFHPPATGSETFQDDTDKYLPK